MHRCLGVDLLAEVRPIRVGAARAMKQLFVTVGTTSFDELVAVVQSRPFLTAARDQGIDRVVVQHGRGKAPEFDAPPGVRCSSFSLTVSTDPYIMASALVIGHAGAGTVLDVLRRRIPLLVVVNTALMGNHQAELARELASRGHVWQATTASLVRVMESDVSLAGGRDELAPLPEPATDRLRAAVDGLLGGAH